MAKQPRTRRRRLSPIDGEQGPLLTIGRVLVPSSWDNHTLLTRLTAP